MSACVFCNDAVTQPCHAAWQLFSRQQAERGGGFGRRVAGNIENARDANHPVDNRHNDVADFINQPGMEHGAVELSATLEHQLAQMKTVAELAQGNVQVDFLLAAEEVGNAGRLEMRQIIVTNEIGDKQDNMIETADFHDPVLGIPVFSLYGQVRRPTAAMLDTFDVVLVDLVAVVARQRQMRAESIPLLNTLLVSCYFIIFIFYYVFYFY